MKLKKIIIVLGLMMLLMIAAVSATGIVMFDEKDSASAPFLSVGGGSSFDFKAWFSNLFADIKAWFVK